MTRQFCTDLACQRGEPLEGTGALLGRHLFINWPKTNWRRPRWETAGLEQALQSAMQAATGSGRYVGLVDDPDTAPLTLFSFPDCTTRLPTSQDEATALVLAWGEGTPFAGAEIGGKVILCCTDAKTDACCARYGFGLFKALAAEAPSHNTRILQCTHIGGCHFAPSVIVMPDRVRYGRLTPADVPALLRSLAADEHYLPRYKGNPALSEPQQVAEIAALRWAAARQLAQSEVRLLDERMVSERQIIFHAQVCARQLEIQLTQVPFTVHSSCRNVEELSGKAVLRWTLSGVSPLA